MARSVGSIDSSTAQEQAHAERALKRLTPGWETVLSKRAIATAYVAMAVGLTASALVTQGLRKSSGRSRRH
jgi:hypothetical protein